MSPNKINDKINFIYQGQTQRAVLSSNMVREETEAPMFETEQNEQQIIDKQDQQSPITCPLCGLPFVTTDQVVNCLNTIQASHVFHVHCYQEELYKVLNVNNEDPI